MSARSGRGTEPATTATFPVAWASFMQGFAPPRGKAMETETVLHGTLSVEPGIVLVGVLLPWSESMDNRAALRAAKARLIAAMDQGVP